MKMPAPSLVCTGCGTVVSGAQPFRCPEAEGDVRDHVLNWIGPPTGATLATEGDPNPFIRHRRLAFAWQVAQARGMADHGYVALVRDLDRAVAAIDGHGFSITPYRVAPAVAKVLGLGDGGLWIKDETSNVAGSHKARHLFGLAIYLAVAERTGLIGASEAVRPLAIASCGNAALAAAVVARAAGRHLRVFVPTWADTSVIARLTALGAAIETCPRREQDPPGDPCHHRFREAVMGGDLPFCCQGSDNGLTIDGGRTLGFELAVQSASVSVDRVMIQVGGGALGSSVIEGLRWAHDLGVLSRLPAIHAVQTAGGFPLVRAWRGVARLLASERRAPVLPAADQAVDRTAARADAAVARWLTAHTDSATIDRAIHAAAQERARFMWPWETEPRSAASGILDDETYDWLAIVRGMLTTGGWPVVASEPNIIEAQCDGRGAGIAASATGTAGLSGAIALAQAGLLDADERVAVVFTGADR